MIRILFTFLFITKAYAGAWAQPDTLGIQLVDAASFNKLLQLDEPQLVDVRTAGEFDNEHISGAVNIDIYKDFEQKITQLDKNKPVMVYCEAGARSADAAALLKKAGFMIYDLSGGIKAWKENHLPLISKYDELQDRNRLSIAEYHKWRRDRNVLMVYLHADHGGEKTPTDDILGELTGEYQQLLVLSMNMKYAVKLAAYLNITTMPVFITFKKGVLIKRVSGEKSKEELRALILELL